MYGIPGTLVFHMQYKKKFMLLKLWCFVYIKLKYYISKILYTILIKGKLNEKIYSTKSYIHLSQYLVYDLQSDFFSKIIKITVYVKYKIKYIKDLFAYFSLFEIRLNGWSKYHLFHALVPRITFGLIHVN